GPGMAPRRGTRLSSIHDVGAQAPRITQLFPAEQKPSHVQARQQWRDDTLNAKGNFRFERQILGWRDRQLVDLRRKR
ncbi:MAG: hypothetical protein OXQ89_12100, partial [Rhodospirillaceae bacterium]|nr:hypothetical protein [Rhodospirillaceae bacterium]